LGGYKKGLVEKEISQFRCSFDQGGVFNIVKVGYSTGYT
jgi:hypothetical protein